MSRVFITWSKSGDELLSGSVEEGAGMGSGAASIADAIAQHLLSGNVILNLREALEEHARRSGWVLELMRRHPDWDKALVDWIAFAQERADATKVPDPQ